MINQFCRAVQISGVSGEETVAGGGGWSADGESRNKSAAVGPAQLQRPANYDLKGIRDRMKLRQDKYTIESTEEILLQKLNVRADVFRNF